MVINKNVDNRMTLKNICTIMPDTFLKTHNNSNIQQYEDRTKQDFKKDSRCYNESLFYCKKYLFNDLRDIDKSQPPLHFYLKAVRD